ncbi:acetylcholinesterase-like [Haemaphysalis longicornis]
MAEVVAAGSHERLPKSSLVDHSQSPLRQNKLSPRMQVAARISLVAAAFVGVLLLLVLVAKAAGAIGKPRLCAPSDAGLLVNLSLGAIRGVKVEAEDGRRARVFFGIPFAATPPEEQRFGPAHEVTELRSVFLADKKGPACVQPNIYSFGQHEPSNLSDDCLTLNVYTPDACWLRGREPLPVLFFVGGYMSHTLGWSGAYDWQNLASRGHLVVVAPNHRMGVVGYLNSGQSATSNMGVRDVLLAWRWTKEHIAAFGGDPDNVVPLAHSSGAVMMTALLAKPQLVTAKRAIILSQSLFTFSLPQTGDIGPNRTRKAALLVGCCEDSTCSSLPLDGEKPFSVLVSCLSNINASQLAEQMASGLSELDVMSEPLGLKPRRLPGNHGFFDGMRLLVGSVMHENDRMLLTWLRHSNLTDAPMSEAIARLVDALGFPSKFAAFMKAFVGVDSNREDLLSKGFQLSTRVLYHCPLTEYAERATRAGAQVYYFVLNEEPYPTPDRLNYSSFGDDLLFISGSSAIANGSATQAQRQLSMDLMDNVAAFAKTGS